MQLVIRRLHYSGKKEKITEKTNEQPIIYRKTRGFINELMRQLDKGSKIASAMQFCQNPRQSRGLPKRSQ